MMDLIPQCFIMSFIEIGPLVPGQILKGLNHICTLHVNDFSFHIQDLVENGLVVSEKSKF